MSQSILDGLLKRLDETPEDKFLYGIIADVLEEIGDKRAEGMRWLQMRSVGIAKNSQDYVTRDNHFWLYPHCVELTGIAGYRWYSAISDLKLLKHPSGSNLWEEIKDSDDNWVQYPTIHDAILDLANVYVKLQEKLK